MPARMIAFILAGGRGYRLYPLAKERAKPVLPFGEKFRIIDFAGGADIDVSCLRSAELSGITMGGVMPSALYQHAPVVKLLLSDRSTIAMGRLP